MNIRIENSLGFHPVLRRIFDNYYVNYKKYYLADIIINNLMIEESYDSNKTLSQNIKNRFNLSNKLEIGGLLYIVGKCYFIPPKLNKKSFTVFEYLKYYKDFTNNYDDFMNFIISVIEQREFLINSFNLMQNDLYEKFKALEKEYEKGEISDLIDYYNEVIRNSFYYIPLPQNNDKLLLEFYPINKMLYCELELPKLEETPDIKSFSLNIDGTLKCSHFSTKEIKKLYEKMIYSIIIRTINELFNLDYKNYIDIIAINGKVKRINPATGIETDNCILSIQTNKTEFSKINPLQVDPHSCFKYLKGISGIDLSNYVPIKPFFQIQKDKRTVESHEVEVSSVTNLAAMNWEEFEHLIRALFEKEFSENGGEVKVTRASRDGGVDAIAFDPDPIKGGKIVIQAKRYTNIVGVSAVRDLYGTVLNEGANKGILVTTSDYGSDSYEFIKGKPLTLLNGNNLLYLLEKHGQSARIDIQEAKDFFKKME